MRLIGAYRRHLSEHLQPPTRSGGTVSRLTNKDLREALQATRNIDGRDGLWTTGQ